MDVPHLLSRISPNTWSTWFVVQQSPGHQQRVISRQPSPVPPFVLSVDGRQIEFIGNIRYKSCQVVFRQLVLHLRKLLTWPTP